jgi:subtilase family serine protease
VLRGTVGSLSPAFGVKLRDYNYNGKIYRGLKGWLHVPGKISSIVRGVHGLDNRPHSERYNGRLLKTGRNRKLMRKMKLALPTFFSRTGRNSESRISNLTQIIINTPLFLISLVFTLTLTD